MCGLGGHAPRSHSFEGSTDGRRSVRDGPDRMTHCASPFITPLEPRTGLQTCQERRELQLDAVRLRADADAEACRAAVQARPPPRRRRLSHESVAATTYIADSVAGVMSIEKAAANGMPDHNPRDATVSDLEAQGTTSGVFCTQDHSRKPFLAK